MADEKALEEMVAELRRAGLSLIQLLDASDKRAVRIERMISDHAFLMAERGDIAGAEALINKLQEARDG